ncbi:MAG TPA: 30S ribosomal protein S16 [Bacteroidota bacterium]|nr:30S ribosomal protein S16 [Bacteroidota bacterium]
MAVRLRLRRVGKKKMPIYHIVAADSRAARNGKFLEIIGRYEPLQHPAQVTAKEERVFHWLKNGALPTDTVRSLLQRSGLWMKWSLTKKGKDQAFIATEMEKWRMAEAEKLQRADARKARRAEVRKKKKAAADTAGAAPAAEPAAAPPEA